MHVRLLALGIFVTLCSPLFPIWMEFDKGAKAFEKQLLEGGVNKQKVSPEQQQLVRYLYLRFLEMKDLAFSGSGSGAIYFGTKEAFEDYKKKYGALPPKLALETQLLDALMSDAIAQWFGKFFVTKPAESLRCLAGYCTCVAHYTLPGAYQYQEDQPAVSNAAPLYDAFGTLGIAFPDSNPPAENFFDYFIGVIAPGVSTQKDLDDLRQHVFYGKSEEQLKTDPRAEWFDRRLKELRPALYPLETALEKFSGSLTALKKQLG